MCRYVYICVMSVYNRCVKRCVCGVYMLCTWIEGFFVRCVLCQSYVKSYSFRWQDYHTAIDYDRYMYMYIWESLREKGPSVYYKKV